MKIRWVAGMAAVLLLAVCTASAAWACALDQVPSISMNGRLAVANQQPAETSAALARWAPFVFPARPGVRQVVRFGENRREVARSLTSQAMSHPAEWRFGDGAQAYGWTVRHAYHKPGTFRITVLAYDRTSRRWYSFDEVMVLVGAGGR